MRSELELQINSFPLSSFRLVNWWATQPIGIGMNDLESFKQPKYQSHCIAVLNYTLGEKNPNVSGFYLSIPIFGRSRWTSPKVKPRKPPVQARKPRKSFTWRTKMFIYYTLYKTRLFRYVWKTKTPFDYVLDFVGIQWTLSVLSELCRYSVL